MCIRRPTSLKEASLGAGCAVGDTSRNTTFVSHTETPGWQGEGGGLVQVVRENQHRFLTRRGRSIGEPSPEFVLTMTQGEKGNFKHYQNRQCDPLTPSIRGVRGGGRCSQLENGMGWESEMTTELVLKEQDLDLNLVPVPAGKEGSPPATQQRLYEHQRLKVKPNLFLWPKAGLFEGRPESRSGTPAGFCSC